MSASRLRLGVNIDHVATVRNARGGAWPNPVRAALMAVEAGADGITAHLREDRRHIRDADMAALKQQVRVPLNFEMAATDEMVAIALAVHPHAACLVPEKREERTTEGGLDIVRGREHLRPRIAALTEAGIRVSLFVEPDEAVMDAAKNLGAPVVELHTGSYCEAVIAGEAGVIASELARIERAAQYGSALGLEIHAGHGLSLDSVGAVAALPQLAELNIGHALIAEAIFVGLPLAVRDMRAAMDEARSGAGPRMILGIGSDLCDIDRIARSLARYGDRFTHRIFTDGERARCDARAVRAPSYARRFAAKEACAKALGTGISQGVFWRDMEVVNLPGGRPTLHLTGGALARLNGMLPPGHEARVHVSLTDDPPMAQAFVIVEAVPVASVRD